MFLCACAVSNGSYADAGAVLDIDCCADNFACIQHSNMTPEAVIHVLT